jgi:predicted RNase H-like HicB family nuclease
MNKADEKIKVIIEKTKDGYSAYTEEFPVYTIGHSVDEIKANILEAINLYKEHNNLPFLNKSGFQFNLDLPSFFELYPVINAAALSKKINMNKSLLSQYITGKKQPSEKQAQKIITGIREIGQELSNVHF